MISRTLSSEEKNSLTAFAKKLAERGTATASELSPSMRQTAEIPTKETGKENAAFVEEAIKNLERQMTASSKKQMDRIDQLERKISLLDGEINGVKDIMLRLEASVEEKKTDLTETTRQFVEEINARFTEAFKRIEASIQEISSNI